MNATQNIAEEAREAAGVIAILEERGAEAVERGDLARAADWYTRAIARGARGRRGWYVWTAVGRRSYRVARIDGLSARGNLLGSTIYQTRKPGRTRVLDVVEPGSDFANRYPVIRTSELSRRIQ